MNLCLHQRPGTSDRDIYKTPDKNLQIYVRYAIRGVHLNIQGRSKELTSLIRSTRYSHLHTKTTMHLQIVPLLEV